MPLAPRPDDGFARHHLPYPAPPAGGALRLAFVGDAARFGAAALDEQSARVQTAFVDLGSGGDLTAALRAARPHVVVAFEPQRVPPGAFDDLGAATLGFLTEPLPRAGRGSRRARRRALKALSTLDGASFDRLVAVDPSLGEAAPVWRALALPVADRCFADVRPIEGAPRAVFLGPWTDHREAWLWGPARHHGLRHVVGVTGVDALEPLLRDCDVGVNVHPAEWATFEHRVALHLAAGNLLVSEELAPSNGLEPGIDFLEVDSPRALMDTLYALRRFPAMHDRVRIRGRMKAEQFRASVVWPRLVHDLLLDLRAFGSARAAA